MIAAAPVLVTGCNEDWASIDGRPGRRSEFAVGSNFMRANGPQSLGLLVMARWVCIPISLIGGYFAYRWSCELYGRAAGLLTLWLWTFEPNLSAHAELVTPDCATWSFGILAGYAFWRWLRHPTWAQATLAGVALGIAELTKFTWIVLFGLWPAPSGANVQILPELVASLRGREPVARCGGAYLVYHVQEETPVRETVSIPLASGDLP